MKIGWDARMAAHSGIGSYTRGILKVLTRRPDEFDLTLFGDLAKIADFSAKKVLADFPIYSLREQILLPMLLARHPVDLLHVPHYNAPLGWRGRLVVTVHDLIHLRFPPSKLAYFYARTLMEFVCRKAAAVIADSERTKRDLIELIGADAEKIRVIYPGGGEDFGPDPKAARPPSQDYIFYAGNLKPTKNVRLLVDAFMQARKEIPDARLVLAGRDFMPEYTASLKGLPGVQYAGEVSSTRLKDLYRNARLFAFPSLYEGFGLPPLEAMSCGVPVVCSNAASLPEVVGDAALLFDPRDQDALARALVGLWKDDRARLEYAGRGRQRAKQFTWEKCADAVAQVYRDCA